jgi:alginate lyase
MLQTKNVTLLAVLSMTAGCGSSGRPVAPAPPIGGQGGGPGGYGGSGGQAGGGSGGAGAGGAAEADAAAPSDAAPSLPPPSPDAAAVGDAPVAPAPDGGAGWAALTAGWTEKPFAFDLHYPFDLDPSARHSFDAATNTHSFWVLRGDKPHLPPPNTTAARSELRMRNDYTSGTHQFEADVFVVSGTNDSSVMQIFGGITHATSIMFKAFPDGGGAVKRYDGPEVVKAMAYDRWWHLNVIHEANGSGIGKIKVYADGEFIGTFDDRGNATHYFKCGVYGPTSDRAESRFRNIKQWVK